MSTTYGYRIAELRDLLTQVPPAANDMINQNFLDCINRYTDLRQSAMDDLVDFMAKASATNLGTQSKWQSRNCSSAIRLPGTVRECGEGRDAAAGTSTLLVVCARRRGEILRHTFEGSNPAANGRSSPASGQHVEAHGCAAGYLDVPAVGE